MSYFHATYANTRGEIFEAPHHGIVCCSAQHFVMPSDGEMIFLPDGSKFFTMPDYEPIGWNSRFGTMVLLNEGRNELWTVCAFLPPGYTRLLLPGTYYHTSDGILPLWAYCALAWKDDKFWVPAVKIDDTSHWDPARYDDTNLEDLIQEKRSRLKGNRLVQQLATCARQYHCFAGKNVFFERWECPMPTSPVCNANCVGCISLQPSGKCSASMERLSFVPTVDEIAELAIDHLTRAPEAFISFGQGCEGEPLLQTPTLEGAIKKILSAAPGATINLNTNASYPDAVKRLCDAGLSSIRVSLNSARTDVYMNYFRPKNYTFSDVLQSLRAASDAGIYVMINLLVFPGITDQEGEVESLIQLLKTNNVRLIQWRNLNIDPYYYLEVVGYPEKPGIGILKMMNIVKQELPEIQFGYFNRQKDKFF